jgi:hypothetical protein
LVCDAEPKQWAAIIGRRLDPRVSRKSRRPIQLLEKIAVTTPNVEQLGAQLVSLIAWSERPQRRERGSEPEPEPDESTDQAYEPCGDPVSAVRGRPRDDCGGNDSADGDPDQMPERVQDRCLNVRVARSYAVSA